MNWLTAATRLAIGVALAGLLGWYYGHPLLAITAALLCLVSYWIIQMRQVQLWLDNPEQSPPEIYGIWGDILSRIYQHQRKEQATRLQLQSTVDYLRDSFSSMRDGVAIVNDHGVLTWFNQPAQLMLRLRADDTGQTLVNLVRSPEFLEYFNRGDYSEALQYHSNSEVPVHLMIQITHFGEGDRLLFIRDVSASVRMEQVRRDFVGNVSHELRTPLTVITGYLGTLLGDRDGLNPRYIKPLQQMLQQADRMETMLKDLLWLSRIESDERVNKRQAVNIPALLAELREELSSSHTDRAIELEVDTQHQVYGDYRELYSAISNLAHNALKYSPQDSVVRIAWREVDASYQLSVQDQGIGIDPLHFPRLTERFYRVDDSRHTASGGTGLGLAIVKHVAAAHDARLQIDSQLGEGSTFVLVFPDQGESVPAPQPAAPMTEVLYEKQG
jgi:two-component system, OmpR family, phosphate regulon sensor histidine kinase PhoR